MQTTSTAPAAAASPAGAPSLKDLAGAAKATRNRAVDLYRALAMVAVALGHWAAIAVSQGPDGELISGNALEFAPNMSVVSWLFQVMPLFFVVGGFSSAMSLDKHAGEGGRPQDWVITRLRRMLAPTVVLAGTWLCLVLGGVALGFGDLILTGAATAAIPLWFLANYTIDTAIAPIVRPAFARRPLLVSSVGLGLFLAIEALRFAGFGAIAHANWVIGWLLFQVAGFAWKDGLLPAGARMLTISAGFWVAAIAAVAFGPWPVSMVNFPGLINSPTHPPSLALLLFGAAYSSTAVAIAPQVSAWLARTPAAWSATVAANGVSLTVYLWHFTAAVAATAILYAGGILPTAAVGTLAWWVQKIPLIALSAVILAGIVALVARFEQAALFAPRTPWTGGQASMLLTAAAVSASVKAWAHNGTTGMLIGTSMLLVLWALFLRPGTAPRPS